MTTYTKLRSGEWGMRVQGNKPTSGDTLTVSKKDGTTKVETVAQVVWSGQGVHVCAIAPAPATASNGTRSRRAWAPCGYPGCNTRHCDECDGAGLWG